MRLLGEQGVPLFYDKKRPPAPANPLGFYESPLVHNLIESDPHELLALTKGRLFKLPFPKRIPLLPAEHIYFVIWLERDPMQSARSLIKMRGGEGDAENLAKQISKNRKIATDHMAASPNFHVLKIPQATLSDHVPSMLEHISPALAVPPAEEIAHRGSSISRQIPTAIRSAHRFARSGFQTTPSDILAEREATCRACAEWDAAALNSTGRCRKCGCSTWAKLRMATEACPIGKWKAVSAAP